MPRSGAAAGRKATEQQVRDSEGSTASLYGLRGGCEDWCWASQAGTNAVTSLPTVGVLIVDGRPLDSCNSPPSGHNASPPTAHGALFAVLEASLGQLAAPGQSVRAGRRDEDRGGRGGTRLELRPGSGKSWAIRRPQLNRARDELGVFRRLGSSSRDIMSVLCGHIQKFNTDTSLPQP
jgi:hypothetical protein